MCSLDHMGPEMDAAPDGCGRSDALDAGVPTHGASDAREAPGDAYGWDDVGSDGGCTMEDLGTYMPRHEFRRMSCKACGAVHWEQPQRTLPAFQYCPRCGRKVERWEWR